jgi:hypothetical protein
LEDKDILFFGAPGREDGSLRIPVINHGQGNVSPVHVEYASQVMPNGPLIPGETVHSVDANTRIPESDAMYNDQNYEDEVDVAYSEL